VGKTLKSAAKKVASTTRDIAKKVTGTGSKKKSSKKS
jgi:hypothetical protein